MEGLFSCMACVDLLKDPVIQGPCGHTCCKECLSDEGGEKRCSECDEPVSTILPNTLLDSLTGKFIYSRQVLAIS